MDLNPNPETKTKTKDVAQKYFCAFSNTSLYLPKPSFLSKFSSLSLNLS